MHYRDFYTGFLKGVYPTELSREDKNSFFLSSCKSGHLQVAQWLWSISNGTIDIHADYEDAFRMSCENGHLEVAQWLWSISNGMINIYTGDECIFRWSCRNGHLEVVQWLWRISNGTIDIYTIDIYPFKWSSGNSHLQVAQWLWCISNKIFNNKYKIGKRPYYYQNTTEIITIYYIKHNYYKPYTGPGYLCAIRED
jgi:hypothetical protein